MVEVSSQQSASEPTHLSSGAVDNSTNQHQNSSPINNNHLKNTAPLILAIDNGTQSIRAMLIDLNGNIVAKSQRPLNTTSVVSTGYVEQPAEYFWQQLMAVCQQLWLQPQVIKHQYQQRVSGVTLTTQRGTVIHVNAKGQPLRPAIIWLDQRQVSVDNLPSLPWYFNLAFTLLGQQAAIRYFREQAEVNWVAANQPDIAAQTHKVLLLSGYLTYQLIGEFKDSTGAIVGYLPFDYKRQQWASRWDWKWRALSINSSQLPDLVKPGEQLGIIRDDVSALLGLPPKLPLIAAASDKACEVLGSGCFSPEVASISYGTTATINTHNARYVEPQPFIPAFPAAIPEQFNSEMMIYRGFWMVSWFKQEFAQQEMAIAEQQGIAVESLFDQLVAAVPAGANGLMLQPYWSPGLKNLEAKGAIIGFSAEHNRAHIYRAILEGIAYALKEGQQQLAKRQRIPITHIMVSGGGSQSEQVMQLTADIFNMPVSRPHTFETSALGAAINAAVGLGYYKDHHQAAQQMTRLRDTFFPNPQNAALYQQLYQQVYLKMYRQLKPIYQQIHKIMQ
jgi:sugar (pentulose or hexulose) kinase